MYHNIPKQRQALAIKLYPINTFERNKNKKNYLSVL